MTQISIAAVGSGQKIDDGRRILIATPTGFRVSILLPGDEGFAEATLIWNSDDR